MERIISRIRAVIGYDKYIREHDSSNQPRGTLIWVVMFVAAFFALSVVNAIQGAWVMLIFTLSGAIGISVGMLLTAFTGCAEWVRYITLAFCSALFTVFIFIGGNDGFAALWLILVPFISMIVIDMRAGFCISAYFALLLIALFWTPLRSFLLYDYGANFLIRFPLLYLSSLAFALYITVVLKRHQYSQLVRQSELFYEKDFDKMTGVLNRSRFEELSADTFRRYNTIGVLFFDVNFLKLTNDNYGHQLGDILLIRTAESLQNVADEHSYIFRIGGDEFVVVLPNCSEKSCNDYIALWKRRLEEICTCDRKLHYSVAYGYSFGKPGYDLDEVIREADSAMYEHKEEIKNADRPDFYKKLLAQREDGDLDLF